MREVWDGVVMACRRWPVMLGLSGMIASACVVFALALEDVVSQVAVLKGAVHLRERHAVMSGILKRNHHIGFDGLILNNREFLMDIPKERIPQLGPAALIFRGIFALDEYVPLGGSAYQTQ